tara:strand:- start:111 stop:371 length:261 start_codon:yes stop_codon:yes gene_type:complete
MKNGKWKWRPDSSCLLAKIINIDEAYQLAMQSVTGTHEPARASSLAAAWQQPEEEEEEEEAMLLRWARRCWHVYENAQDCACRSMQ